MTSKTIPAPGIGSIAMIGAGLCAAVLFTVLRQGTLPAMMLAQLTPLPIMISAIGFGPAIGAGSAIVATFAVALLATLHEGALSSTTALTGAIMGLVFAVTQVLPAWWLGFISCLARPDDAGRWRVAPADKKSLQLNFYPIGHILVHAAIISICLICLMSCIIVLGYGGVDATMEELTAKLQPLVQKLVDSQPELASFNVESLTHLVIMTTPAIMATWYLMMFLGNLWVAGRVALTSNRLRRPWPNIAQELSLPRSLVLGLIAAAGLCFVKSWPGTIGLIATATLVAIYALQGLAVVHYLSRGLRWRGLILFSIYAVLILFIPWPLALFALLGLADVAFSLRDRKAAALLASKS